MALPVPHPLLAIITGTKPPMTSRNRTEEGEMQPFPFGSSGAAFEPLHSKALGLHPAWAGPGAEILLPPAALNWLSPAAHPIVEPLVSPPSP